MCCCWAARRTCRCPTLVATPPPEALVERGRMMERARSYRLALEAFGQAAARDPSRLDAHEGMVRAAVRCGRTDEVERALRRMADGSSPVNARIALALLYHNQ